MANGTRRLEIGWTPEDDSADTTVGVPPRQQQAFLNRVRPYVERTAVAPANPVEATYRANQRERAAAQQPITQSLDYRMLRRDAPSAPSQFELERDLRNARVGTDNPALALVEQANLRRQFANRQLARQQALQNAFTGAQQTELERNRLLSAEQRDFLGAQRDLARQELMNRGALDVAERQALASEYGSDASLAAAIRGAEAQIGVARIGADTEQDRTALGRAIHEANVRRNAAQDYISAVGEVGQGPAAALFGGALGYGAAAPPGAGSPTDLPVGGALGQRLNTVELEERNRRYQVRRQRLLDAGIPEAVVDEIPEIREDMTDPELANLIAAEQLALGASPVGFGNQEPSDVQSLRWDPWSLALLRNEIPWYARPLDIAVRTFGSIPGLGGVIPGFDSELARDPRTGETHIVRLTPAQRRTQTQRARAGLDTLVDPY